MNMKQTKEWKRRALYSALAVALVGGAMAVLPNAIATPQAPEASGATLQYGPPSFSRVIKGVQPAVVNVSTTGQSRMMPGSGGPMFDMPELPEGTPFGKHFEEFLHNRRGMSRGDKAEREYKAVGSGFIVSADGYVVTNFHVVDGADSIEVVTQDGDRHQARVMGSDAKTDLALIKIDADKPLPYVEFGDSDDAEVGDWVIAVGNPFGLGGTVTAGIISARGRDIQSGPFDDYLQVDAPINRGNSGGPLFDAQGRVLGINTAIYSPGGGSVGIGFAIPANMARDVIAQLKTSGGVARGWLGVHIQPLTEEIAQSLRLGELKGALVSSVIPDSPAAHGGVKAGDIITGMNGEALSDFRDLPKRIAKAEAGSKARFEIIRKGETRELRIEIGAMPGEEAELALAEPAKNTPDTARLGIQLAELTSDTRERYEVPRGSNGVLVTGVEQDSPAAKAGIRPGSIINMVGQERVQSAAEVVTKVREAAIDKRPSVLLLVEYGGEKRFIAVRFATA